MEQNLFVNKIDSLVNQREANIICDYFDFELGDMNLKQLKKSLNLSKESEEEVINLLKSFEIYLKNNLTNCTYPYLQRAFLPFYSKLSQRESRVYLLMLFLSKREEIEKSLYTFFHFLIKTSHFGIGKQYNSLFTKNVVHSVDYMKFVDKMTRWHTMSESVIFYLWVLKEYFDLSFDYQSRHFTIENNFMLTFETFAKKNLLKLSSYVCGKIALPLNMTMIDYKQMLFLVIASFTCGSFLGSFALFTTRQIQKLIGVSMVNVAISKMSELMKYEEELIDFRKLSDTIDQLNSKLTTIQSIMIKLIKAELIIDINVQPGQQETNEGKEVNELKEKLSLYLSGMERDEEITLDSLNIIENIEMKETDSDWLIIEDNNHKEYKTK